MITGFHRLTTGPALPCRTQGCINPATIALHEEWRPGEPIDLSQGSSRFVFHCEPCAEYILSRHRKEETPCN